MRPTAYIFDMQQSLVVPYINPTIPLESKLAVLSCHRLIMGKTLKIFSEGMMPLAYIISMLQCIVFPYINPASHTPGVQIGHSMGGSFAPIDS